MPIVGERGFSGVLKCVCLAGACGAVLAAHAVGGVSLAVETMPMPTYPYGDPDPVAAAFPGRYPYFRYDGQSATALTQTWETVVLSNGHIAVTAFPAIGGKVWGAKDLKTGREFIYANDAVKFRDIAMRGPWCSGGIEFNFGITGHAQWTVSPVDWTTRTNADGSASYFFGGCELVTRTFWQVEVLLRPGEDFFTTKLTWHNYGGQPCTRYQWSTAAITARGNPEMVYPGTHQINHDGRAYPWPRDEKGVDRSIYANDDDLESVSWHVINGDNRFFGTWWDGWKFGMWHRSAAEDKFGRKIFMWSQARSGVIWEDLLTDTAGQYVELQSGRGMQQQVGACAATPFKFQTLFPGATDTFEEQWGCTRDRAVFDAAKAFPSAEIARPTTFPADYDTNSVYALYRDGEQLMREGHEVTKAAQLFEQALAKDPCFVPALDELAAFELRRGHVARAEALAEKALAVDTYDGPANFVSGEIALDAGRLDRARERFGVAALDPAYRPAALVRLGMVAIREKDFQTAVRCAEKALAASADDPEAHQLAAVAARLAGDVAGAKRAAERGLVRTPVHYGLRYEAGAAPSALTRCELPGPTLVEIGLWYAKAGLMDDAKRIWSAAPKYPVARLFAGDLTGALVLPVELVYPHGREVIAALEAAVQANPSWVFKYYLAIALAPFGDAARVDELLDACGNEPDAAAFYLVRASRRTGETALADLKRAAALGDSWRVGCALAKTYRAGGRYDEAVAVANDYRARFPGHQQLDGAAVEALVEGRRYAEAVEILRGMKVLPSEFNKAVPQLWNTCHRELAAAAVAAGDRAAALGHIDAVLAFPENLGAGRPVRPLTALKDWPREVTDLVEVSSATSMEKVRPRDGAARAEAKELKVRLARGETEAVQVFVRAPGRDLKGVRVRVTDLLRRRTTCGDYFSFRTALPQSAVKVSVLGYVETTNVPPYKVVSCATDAAAAPALERKPAPPQMGWWPDPILDYLESVDVKAGDRQGFWLSIRAPRDQESGVYEGEIVVEADGAVVRTLPIAVRVNGFTLPVKTPLPTAITFGAHPNTQHESGENLARAKRLKADPHAPCNLWKRHAQEWSDFLADRYVTFDNLYHGDLTRDGFRIPALRKLADEGRLDCFNLGYWSYPKSLSDADKQAWREATLARLRKSYDAVKAAGLEKYAYLYGCDEIAKQYFPCIQWAIGELKASFPGVPISTTAYDHEYGVGTALAAMDWFTPLSEAYNAEKAAAARREGRQVWWYICCGPRAPYANMFVECPAIEGRILMGAQTAKYRPDGFLYYQTSIWNSERPISGPSAFTDWSARSWTQYNGDGSWLCAGPDATPMTTVRFENFRDGLEDFAYVKLLEERLAKTPDAPWAAQARELLAVPKSVAIDKTHFTNDPAVLYAWRDAMADLLDATF